MTVSKTASSSSNYIFFVHGTDLDMMENLACVRTQAQVRKGWQKNLLSQPCGAAKLHYYQDHYGLEVFEGIADNPFREEDISSIPDAPLSPKKGEYLFPQGGWLKLPPLPKFQGPSTLKKLVNKMRK